MRLSAQAGIGAIASPPSCCTLTSVEVCRATRDAERYAQQLFQTKKSTLKQAAVPNGATVRTAPEDATFPEEAEWSGSWLRLRTKCHTTELDFLQAENAVDPNSEPWSKIWAPIDNCARLHILRFTAFPPSWMNLLLPGKCEELVRHLS